MTLHDTDHGLKTQVNDLTTGESGSMTSSAANGFGMIKYAPNPSTECTNIPYDFHPMYSASSEQTRVIWAAHSYNLAFSDEIGHFDYCSGATPIPATAFGASCPATDRKAARATWSRRTETTTSASRPPGPRGSTSPAARIQTLASTASLTSRCGRTATGPCTGRRYCSPVL